MVGVQFELRFSIIAVLHKRHLFSQNERKRQMNRGPVRESCACGQSHDFGRVCYLHALVADDIERSNHAEDKLTDFSEALVSDAP